MPWVVAIAWAAQSAAWGVMFGAPPWLWGPFAAAAVIALARPRLSWVVAALGPAMLSPFLPDLFMVAVVGLAVVALLGVALLEQQTMAGIILFVTSAVLATTWLVGDRLDVWLGGLLVVLTVAVVMPATIRAVEYVHLRTTFLRGVGTYVDGVGPTSHALASLGTLDEAGWDRLGTRALPAVSGPSITVSSFRSPDGRTWLTLLDVGMVEVASLVGGRELVTSNEESSVIAPPPDVLLQHVPGGDLAETLAAHRRALLVAIEAGAGADVVSPTEMRSRVVWHDLRAVVAVQGDPAHWLLPRRRRTFQPVVGVDDPRLADWLAATPTVATL